MSARALCWRLRPARSRWRRCAGVSASAGSKGYKWLRRWQAEGAAGLADRRGRRGAIRRRVAEELLEACLALRRAASDLGAGEGEGGARAAKPRAAVAGGEHDRRALRPRGADGDAPAPAACAARGAALRRRRGQRRLGHRLQGLVPHRRRHPRRPADARRRLQPLPPALPSGGALRHHACLADPRRRLPRIRPAAAPALRRRTEGASRPPSRRPRRRALPARGQGDQGRGHARAHRPRQAAGERPARAAAPDALQDPADPPAATLRAQQRAVSEVPGRVQRERPHAALGNATPAERYTPSPRRWDGVLRSPEPAGDGRSAG